MRLVLIDDGERAYKAAMKRRARQNYIYNWHEYFAWHPVWTQVSECKRVLVWLEHVERRLTWKGIGGVPYTVWQYRDKGAR